MYIYIVVLTRWCISAVLLFMMAVVPGAAHPCVDKQVRYFRLIFISREMRGKNKQKMPKSPRTSTPGAVQIKINILSSKYPTLQLVAC